MSTINPLVIDLSHYDDMPDFNQVKASGIVGIIYKATQGSSFRDPTYKNSKQAALDAGLKWGSYHFGDSRLVLDQVENYLNFANPLSDELICLDFEDNGGYTMSLSQAFEWITRVELVLDCINNVVLYSGDLIKNALGNSKDGWWAAHRLWLAQYASTPIVPACWSNYWLWQFTDGSNGPIPHEVAGCSGLVDINSYAGSATELAEHWS